MSPPLVERLSKPPIVEAVIDFRVTTEAPLELEALQPLRAALSPRFVTAQPIHLLQAEIRLEAESNPQPALTSRPGGLRFESADKRFVVLCRGDGVGISRLAPYEGWSGLLGVAREVWESYRSVVRPKSVTRLGVRFIIENYLTL